MGTLPYRCTARRGDQLVADTTAAVRVDGDGDDRPPQLWFPTADTTDPTGSEAGEGALTDHVRFGDEVELEIHDPTGGEPAAIIDFPNWGDAADLIAVLDVVPDGDGSWVGPTQHNWRRPVVEGSQLLAQAIVAGVRHAPDRRIVQATMIFNRAVTTQGPYSIDIDEVANGRTVTALRTAAVQGGRTCAFGTLLLDVGAPDLIRDEVATLDVAGPADAAPIDMGVTGRAIRIVDDAYTGDPDAPVGPPRLHAWVRFAEVPADPAMNAALLAQFTGHLSIAAALRPHAGIGQDQAHVTISTAINAISLSLHADIRADRWMRYDHLTTFAGDGMTHTECRVHDEDGRLLASFSVEAMVRGFADPQATVDPRTAL